MNVVGTEDQLLNNVAVAIFVDRTRSPRRPTSSRRIDWGDLTPPTPGVVTRIGSTATGAAIFQVTGSHIYTSSVGSPFGISVGIADEDPSP